MANANLGSLTIVGSGSVTAALHMSDESSSAMVANSSFVISPTGIIVGHFGGAPIPSTAKPLTVPTLRNLPPSSGSPKFTVNLKPAKKNPG